MLAEMRHCRPWLLQKHITLALSIKCEQVLLLCVSATPSSLCRPSTRVSGGLKEGGSMKGCQLQGGKFNVPVVWGTEEGPASKQRPKWYLKLLPGPSLVGNDSFSIRPWHGRAVHAVQTRSCRLPSITYSYSSLHIISLSRDMLASHHLWIKWFFMIYARALQRIQS